MIFFRSNYVFSPGLKKKQVMKKQMKLTTFIRIEV